MRAAALALAVVSLAATARPADTPRPDEGIKGKVMEVGTTTIRIQVGAKPPVDYQVPPALRAQAGQIKKGSDVTARVRYPEGGAPLIVSFVSIKPPAASTGTPGTGDRPDAQPRRGSLLVSVDREIELTIDLTRKVKVPRGGTTIEVAPGEHMLSALSTDGWTWRKAVKVGSEQTVVEITLSPPPSQPAEVDAAAARTWLSLQDVGVAGRRVAWVLSRTNFDFHDTGLAGALQRAHGRLRREAEELARLTGEDWRKEAQKELARAKEAGDRYVDLMTQAVTRAQQDGTVLGEAATLRAKALAEEPAMAVDPKVMASLRGSADFTRLVPPDRRPAAGLPPDPQDFALGAEYDDGQPPALGVVSKNGVADGLGLQPGDHVVGVDGQAPTGGWHLKQLLRAAAGRKTAIEVERRGKRATLRASVPTTLPR
jgi:hypothetical protein